MPSFRGCGHLDDVVGALRMPDQDQRAALSGLVILDDIGNGGLPGQMSDGFGLHAFTAEIVRHRIEPVENT